MFTEDLTPFFDTASGFAVSGTLDGVAVDLIFDSATRDELGVLTLSPSVLLPRAAALDAAAGQVLTVAGVDYEVRAVRHVSPDGALRRLDLARP